MTDDLRSRIAEAIVADLKRAVPPVHAYLGGPTMNSGMPRTELDLADAVLAVVQPELDRRDAAEAKARTDIAAAEADLARCRERLEDTRRIVAEWEDAAAERDRYRAAWQSARRRASGHQTAAHTFSDGGVDDIAELYRAQAAIQTAGGRLTKPVHQAIDAIRAKWDRALRSEQQKRADAEAALAADMRTWCSPHGLADHYADAIEQALGGTSVSSPAARQRQQDALYDQHVRSVVDRVVPENAIQVLKAGDEAGERQ